MLRKGIILFIMILSASCYKVIDITLEHDPKLTVNSLIKANAPIDVYLSESKLMYDTLVPLVQNAVAIIKNKQTSDTLINMGNGLYRSNIIAQTGQIYSIEVQTAGLESVSAMDTLPETGIFKITNFIPEAKYDEDGDLYSEIEIEINDPADEKNYYELAAMRFNEYEDYDEDGNIIITHSVYFTGLRSDNVYVQNEGDADYYPLTILLSDELFNGKTVRIKTYVFYNKGFIKEWYVLYRNVSKTYYQYKKKLIRHYENQYHDFWDGTGNPVQLYSNIENGYGIFAGYCEQRDTIVIADYE